VDGDGLGIIEVLKAHESLYEEGLRVLEVEVHSAHHGDAHVNRAELFVRKE